jgi:hypothetical protein
MSAFPKDSRISTSVDDLITAGERLRVIAVGVRA